MSILHFCLEDDDKKISQTECLELVRLSVQTRRRVRIFSPNVAAINSRGDLGDEIKGYLKSFNVSCIFFLSSHPFFLLSIFFSLSTFL